MIIRDRHHYRHHGDSGILPFLGGVAIGAILSDHSCPPPRVRARVYVYDCDYDACGFVCRDYNEWVNHLVYTHHVLRCDVDRYYPPNQCGYWEEY